MKCTGRYYEDAMQFADDFQKVMEKRKKGDTSTGLKHGKVNRGASVTYKGSGAKAIFYRQLLEYKKSRFFLFGGQTLVSLVVAVGFPVYVLTPSHTTSSRNCRQESDIHKGFPVPFPTLSEYY